jgi:hypothetical protein
MKKIVLKSVPLRHIRNNQCGDWRVHKNKILALTAQMEDPRSELLVAMHEAIEAFLCDRAGITDAQVTDFDALYESERERELHGDSDEAGDDQRAPYRAQHLAATAVERAAAQALGITWDDHERNVADLFEEPVGEVCHGFERAGK